jgi:hypothetical protein
VRNNQQDWAALDAVIAIAKRIPEKWDLYLNQNGITFIDTVDQSGVREIRSLFPECSVWRKKHDDYYWSYTGELPGGVAIRIPYVSEAPPTCRLVKVQKTIMVREPVDPDTPMHSVEKTVEVDEWVCDKEGEAE